MKLMKVASKFHLHYIMYIWPKGQPSGSGHIVDHLNWELLLYMYLAVWKGFKGGIVQLIV